MKLKKLRENITKLNEREKEDQKHLLKEKFKEFKVNNVIVNFKNKITKYYLN